MSRNDNNTYRMGAMRDALNRDLPIVVIGRIYSGRVNAVEKFGVFISVDARLDRLSRTPASGLAHISELADDYVAPADVSARYAVGDRVERCKVLGIVQGSRDKKLTLGLKPSYFITNQDNGSNDAPAPVPVQREVLDDDLLRFRTLILKRQTRNGDRRDIYSYNAAPVGHMAWEINQNFPRADPCLINGWIYGGLLNELGMWGKIGMIHKDPGPSVESKEISLAYRRVGVEAIEELRTQFGKVMGNQGGREPPFPVLFFEAAGGDQVELWSSHCFASDLAGAVLGVRRFVETILYFIQLCEDRGISSSKQGEIILLGDLATRGRRWQTVIRHVNSLMRGSQNGPDAPLHWAAHSHSNRFEITVVTERTIFEIVVRLGVILDELFTGRIPDGVHVSPRAVAPALQDALEASSKICDPQGTWYANPTGSDSDPSATFAAAIEAANTAALAATVP